MTAGLVIGVPVALWMKGYATSVLAILAAVQAQAPITLPVESAAPAILAALAMLLVAIVAAVAPARRATKVDPMVALRCE